MSASEMLSFMINAPLIFDDLITEKSNLILEIVQTFEKNIDFKLKTKH